MKNTKRNYSLQACRPITFHYSVPDSFVKTKSLPLEIINKNLNFLLMLIYFEIVVLFSRFINYMAVVMLP